MVKNFLFIFGNNNEKKGLLMQLPLIGQNLLRIPEKISTYQKKLACIGGIDQKLKYVLVYSFYGARWFPWTKVWKITLYDTFDGILA